MTVDEAAVQLKTSPTIVRRLIARGIIRASKKGWAWRIHPRALTGKSLLARQTTPGRPAGSKDSVRRKRKSERVPSAVPATEGDPRRESCALHDLDSSPRVANYFKWRKIKFDMRD